MKKITFLTILSFLAVITACDYKDKKEVKNPPLNDQVRVQVAYDATDVAFHFTWKSQSKSYPVGQANVGQKYPGQHHEVLKHNGTRFDRLPSGSRIQEDRITFMIDEYVNGAELFDKLSCAASCHEAMESHHLLSDDIVDHWHWRGGRSGPMGYAEDTAIDSVQRIRDAIGTPPSKFTRADGDRLREDQVALAGTGHDALVNGLPRFVFNKGKVMPGNYTIPSFFLTGESNAIITDPYNQIPQVKDMTVNRSQIVVYQDLVFDNVDKVNALDVGYLVYVATGNLDHMPAHLRDSGTADFQIWTTYAAAQSGIQTTAASAAVTKLNEILTEWEGTSRNAMVTRYIGFIYPSDQHDIKSERSFNSNLNEWTVILYRKLSTGSQFDANLAGIRTGTKYSFSFSVHDAGEAAISHNISMPLSLSNGADSDIKAIEVANVKNAEWDKLEYFDTQYVKAEYVNEFKWTRGWLTGPLHAGSGGVANSTCKTCHQANLQNAAILN